MSSSEALSTFLFFCVFEILGGGAIGIFVRELLQRQSQGIGFFFLIWGSGFGGIPLLIGAALLFSRNHPSYFYAQLLVFAAAIGLVALMPAELFDKDARGNLPSVIVGAVITLFGATLIFLTLHNGLSWGLIVGTAVAIGGIFILFRAVLTAFHGR